MSNRKRSRGHRSPLRGRSAESLFLGALNGDAEEPRRVFDPQTDRKTLQLCRQVQRALMLALAGECGDDLLREVAVDSVDPAGGGGHLVVRVIVPGGVSVLEVLARLNSRAGKLRAVVAGSICRKRTPMLSFIAVPAHLPSVAGEGVRHE